MVNRPLFQTAFMTVGDSCTTASTGYTLCVAHAFYSKHRCLCVVHEIFVMKYSGGHWSSRQAKTDNTKTMSAPLNTRAPREAKTKAAGLASTVVDLRLELVPAYYKYISCSLYLRSTYIQYIAP